MNTFSFQFLKKNLTKDFSGFPTIKIAVLGDSATQMYVQAIKGYGYENGINFDIYEADYDQIELQVFNISSDLYKFKPEYVIIFFSSKKIIKKFWSLNVSEKSDFANRQMKNIENIYHSITNTIGSKIIFFNFQEINDTVFGNFSNKTTVSFVYQLRKMNFEMMNFANKYNNFFILDIDILQAYYGNNFITDNKIYVNTELLLSIDFLPIIAKNTIDIINAIIGKFKKCLILDLDNTIWGGIIGDDGIENIKIGDLGIGKVFSEIQLWIKQLKERGIILAICSKNDEEVAKEPFKKHPDMVLRLDDISVFIANWNNKADNIKCIQSILNIGFDSMVFLDDNPFERNMVRSHIKDITIPELPEDPADYLNFIRTLNLFETASYTNADEQRTMQYQEEAQRTILRQQFTDENAFLKSLHMVSVIEPFNNFNIPRVAQLTQRSNQFNLRTVRYSEKEVQIIANDPTFITFAFSLSDKYGDYGLISLIILKSIDSQKLFIDTWVMSCRVLKRNMENFVLNIIAKKAINLGYSLLIGEYLPTVKNTMVKNHYENMGFSLVENYWNLVLDNYCEKDCFIKSK
jgi:FkbH-like protein